MLAALPLIAVPGSAFGGDPAGRAAAPAPAPVPSDAADPLRVYVMTMGPGDHPFFMFGHNAIWIRDHAARTDRVYNFGTFSFDSPRMIFDFLGGRLTYWLSVSPLSRRDGRIPRARTAASPSRSWRCLPRRKGAAGALDENARPENRAYKYDYFLDNCSTRVRDVVDGFVGRATARQRARAWRADAARSTRCG